MGARSFMIPRWTEDVGSLREADGVRVYEKCDGCQTETIVDLDGLIERFGPRYTLWNRTPPCPAKGCDGHLWYRAQPRNYFHKILNEAPAEFVAELHERWKASLPDDVRDQFPVIPMLKATNQVIVAGCGPCEQIFYLGPISARAWGDQITLADLTKRLSRMCRPSCEIVCDMCPEARVPPGEHAS